MAEVLEKGIFFLAHAHKDFFPAKAVAELHRRGFLSSLMTEIPKKLQFTLNNSELTSPHGPETHSGGHCPL